MARVTRPAVLAVAAIATAGALAGCGSSASSGSGAAPTGSASASPAADLTGTVTVLAAASLTEAFTTLGEQFKQAHPGVTLRLSFGASSDLAQQITSGANADVFASASAKNMQQVVDAGRPRRRPTSSATCWRSRCRRTTRAT